MNVIELRDTVIKALHPFVGAEIIMADDTGPKPEEPHATYKITTPYGQGVGRPEEMVIPMPDGPVIQQTTEYKATFSFTAYAMDEDESVLLAQKIYEWFAFHGDGLFDKIGVTISDLTNVTNRDAFVVENYERRNGFDVIIKFMDVKTRKVDWFNKVDINYQKGKKGMSNRYVTVTITRQTKAISQAGFGLPLILSHEKELAYKEYRDIDGIATDYGVESETYKMASAIFGQSPRPFKIAIHGIDNKTAGTPEALVTALNELIKKHNDFFYVHCTDQKDAAITAIAAWVNTQNKLYFASTSNKTLHETLKSQNTILLVTETPDKHPAAAWVGVCAPQTIGSYTWTFMTLNGIVPDGYDETELGEIEKGASAYISEGGVDITSKGVTTTGEYIDILQGQYFIEARMTEAVFGLLARMPKVPFTDPGISMVVAEVAGVLKRSSNQGIIAIDISEVPLYSIAAPSAADVSTEDKANRLLPDIFWTATIAGAVENVDIHGVLKL